MKSKLTWSPIEEMDLDNGQHTCYSSQDSRGNIVWTTQTSNGTWDVEISEPDPEFCQESKIITLANCKTLTSARRWIGRYL